MGIAIAPLSRRPHNGADAPTPSPLHPQGGEDGACAPGSSSIRVHQRCVIELVTELEAFLRDSPVGVTLTPPAAVLLDGKFLAPDLSVIGLANGIVSPSQRDGERLLLAVEVLSPATARCDRLHKRSAYLRHDAVYWIVDSDARLVERWLPGASRPDVLDDELFWFPEGASEPLVVDIQKLFERVFRYFPAPLALGVCA